MKSLKEMLNEGWKYGVDFSTGDTIKFWTSEETKNLPKDAIELMEEDPEEYQKNVEKEKALQKQLEKWEDEQYYLENELNDNKKQLRELRIDMEEELGHLYAKGKEEDAEKLAQKYGEDMNKLEMEIIKIAKKIENCKKQIDDISEEILDIWN